jgi:uracil DNA glycosylase
MMEKREQLDNWYRSLFIDDDVVNDLAAMGSQGVLIRDMMAEEDVSEGIRGLNALSMHETMYPSTPFLPLSYTDIDDIRCVIIGGMPEMDKLEKWNGSAYAYETLNYRSILHKKMIEDFHGSTIYKLGVDSDFYKLQSSGVLMLHEVMSITKEHPAVCKAFWYPIITKILFYISANNSDVPIVFTTTSAMATFRSCVANSNHVYCLRMSGNDGTGYMFPEFEAIECLSNFGVHTKDRIDFLKTITKYDQ